MGIIITKDWVDEYISTEPEGQEPEVCKPSLEERKQSVKNSVR